MTLTQLSAFVLVARLGSVQAAATTLGVSEPAVSQALSALRQFYGDQLIARSSSGMRLTPGGTRLLGIASQMVALGAEAEAAVRAAKGAPDQLRLVATSSLSEFVVNPLVETFVQQTGRTVEASAGVAASQEMPVLVANRLADVALGPYLGSDTSLGLVSEPVFRCQLVVVTSAAHRLQGSPASWQWLVDSSGTDPNSDTSRLLRRLGVDEQHVRVFTSQTSAWESAAAGGGVAVAIAHLVAGRLRRGELQLVDTKETPLEANWYVTTLRPDRRPAAAGSLLHFMSTPRAMQLMRAPGAGVPPSRFRPPVYVTIWS
ncbi:MAG: LysR family transcriptional regulator [Sciscionella sp.]